MGRRRGVGGGQEGWDSANLTASQTCVCANRLFVHEAVYDEFVERFTAAVRSLKQGSPQEAVRFRRSRAGAASGVRVLSTLTSAPPHRCRG